jgi:hypothetical protein
VHEMEIDIQHRRRAVGLRPGNVIVPDFVDECLWQSG